MNTLSKDQIEDLSLFKKLSDGNFEQNDNRSKLDELKLDDEFISLWNTLNDDEKTEFSAKYFIADCENYYNFFRENNFKDSRKTSLKMKKYFEKERLVSINEAKMIFGFNSTSPINTAARQIKVGKRVGNAQLKFTLSDMEKIRKHIIKTQSRGERLKVGKERFGGQEPFFLCINQYKGGVGKTTVATNFVRYLALKGYKVLLIDLDIQSSASYICRNMTHWDFRHLDKKKKTATFLMTETKEKEPWKEIEVLKTNWENIDLLPGHSVLSEAETVLNKFENDFFEKLDHARSAGAFNDYDVVVFDTAPNFSNLTLNAIWVSDGIIMPCYPSMLTQHSMVELYNYIVSILTLIDENYHKKPRMIFSKILPTLFSNFGDRSIKDLKQMRNLHQAINENIVLKPVMKRQPAISDATLLSSTIYEFPMDKSTQVARIMLDEIGAAIENEMIKAWEFRNKPDKTFILNELRKIRGLSKS